MTETEKTLLDNLSSAHDALVEARKVAVLSGSDCATDIFDAIECVEAAIIWLDNANPE